MGKRRKGVLSMLKRNVERGCGGKTTYNFAKVMLNDLCVYCQKPGCNSLDHITPYSKKDQLPEGVTVHSWQNLAPCHQECNAIRKANGVIYGFQRCSNFEGKNCSSGE